MASAEYTYDGHFERSIPIVGQTGCRKTAFVQNLEKMTYTRVAAFIASELLKENQQESKITPPTQIRVFSTSVSERCKNVSFYFHGSL